MSQNEEQKDPTQEQEAKYDAATESVDEVQIVDAMKPPSAPSTKKPLRYGTRKKRAGAQAPAVTKISSISTFEEEEIEMDDLPIRANVPEHLIDSRSNPSERREEDGERRPRRNDRPRGERRGEPRRRRDPEPQEEATTAEQDAEETNEEVSTEAASSETAPARADRPERFGVVDSKGRGPSAPPVQEFRPSRDGRTAPVGSKGERRAPRNKPEKKGILSKILAFFTGGEKEEEKKPTERRPSGRGPGGDRRGPSNRQRPEGGDGTEGGERRRKRRPRNRKPRNRPEGEEGSRQNREGGNREGGNRSRGRRPRREGGPGNRDAGRPPAE